MKGFIRTLRHDNVIRDVLKQSNVYFIDEVHPINPYFTHDLPIFGMSANCLLPPNRSR